MRTLALSILLLSACRVPEDPKAADTSPPVAGGTTFGGDAMAAPAGSGPTGAAEENRPPPSSNLPPGEGPTFPLTLPTDLNLWCTEVRGGSMAGETVEEVFVSRGTKFRLEQVDPARGPVVLLFDGTQVAAMSKSGSKVAPRADEVDLRQRYARLYAEDLARTSVLGKEEVEGRSCWHFSSAGGSQENLSQGSFELWVDVADSTPRKLATVLPGGATLTLTCRNLPSDLTVSDADFAATSLEPRFVTRLPKP